MSKVKQVAEQIKHHVAADGGVVYVEDECPWNGWEALTDWVICLEPKDKATFSPGGIQIVAEKNMRPTTLEVFSVGPPAPLDNGEPGLPLAVKKGDTIIVPEYGVHIHEDPKRGNLRCFRHSQVLARIDPDPVAEPEVKAAPAGK